MTDEVKDTEVDESFLDLGNLDDVPDLHTVGDSEQELRLVTFERRPGKNKGPYLFVEFEIVADPTTKIVRHVMMLPNASDKERTQFGRKRAIKYFYKAFNIPTDQSVVLADYVGNTGWAALTEETDPQYGTQNRIARFMER